jgi:uncharacterized membrane protein
VSATAWELVDFVARWVHVVAGIMWVGNSLLFTWLDRSLQPAGGPSFTRAPLGSAWLLHSGGFYHVEKTLLTGEPLPRPLHWFKWQAYTTWISGALLLLVVYYLSDRATLADPGASGLTSAQASALGLGSIAFGWGLWEATQRWIAPRAETASRVIWLAGFVLVTVALTRWLGGRAAFLHVGALIGSIMAGNVFFTIVPSQRSLVASVGRGQGVDAAVSARAKRVSLFNNFFTFPVIALMVSNHFPAIYGSRWNLALLWIILAGGIGVRHALNRRFTTRTRVPGLAGALGATVAALFAVLLLPARRPAARVTRSPAASAPVTFADARHVIDRRCAACHSEHPSDLTFGAAPAGVMFDTPEQIAARAGRIRERAVVTRTMPPANRTRITDEERAVLARWVAMGAPAR